jgi:chemotaxis protein methyltransferase CheR
LAEEYYRFITKIKKKTGIDLRLYKENQMKRRITSLRNKRGFHNFDAYYDALLQDSALFNEFIDRLTINVSEFYRNPKRWDVLQREVIPYLTKDKSNIFIWSAACSTGEEPYSIAMMMREHFPHIQTEILATDIDENILKKAKEGIYHEQSLKDLPRSFKQKYFRTKHNLFYLDPTIKQKVTFRKHNLLADLYPKQVDLIVCRNVLIYFTDEAKEKIYRQFGKSLNNNGILFVGSTEQIFNPNQYGLELFDTFFYQRINTQNKEY